jgi:hypothetical protein
MDGKSSTISIFPPFVLSIVEGLLEGFFSDLVLVTAIAGITPLGSAQSSPF